MSEKIETVLPPEEPKGKRKRGRPKHEVALTPLHNLPGETKEEKLESLFQMWGDCKRCILGEMRCQVYKDGGGLVFGEGNPDAHVLLVGEAPGEQEEESGSPFVGPAGQMLNQILSTTSDDDEIQALADWYAQQPRAGKKGEEAQDYFHDKMWHWRAREFYITNVVACRPPENRQPTLPEMRTCWERLWNIIYIVDPLLIVVFGNSALAAITQKTSGQITKMRGQLFDVTFPGKVGPIVYPVLPLFHPSYLARVADWRVKDGAYAKTIEDWKRAMRVLDFLRLQNFGTPIPNRGGRAR